MKKNSATFKKLIITKKNKTFIFIFMQRRKIRKLVKIKVKVFRAIIILEH